MPEDLFDELFAEIEEGDGDPELDEAMLLADEEFDPAFLQILRRSPAVHDPQLRWEELAALMDEGGAGSILRNALGLSPEMLMQQQFALEDEILAMEFEDEDW